MVRPFPTRLPPRPTGGRARPQGRGAMAVGPVLDAGLASGVTARAFASVRIGHESSCGAGRR